MTPPPPPVSPPGPPLPFRHPASLLATWFGSGLLPKAPGTWGSLAALPCAAVIVWAGGNLALIPAIVMATGLGLWASDAYAIRRGLEDPGEVVIDEVVGMWLALFFVPLDWSYYVLAFALFRFFDIAKVWPINVVERELSGAAAIMADDIVAGVFAGASVHIGFWLFREIF